MTLTAISRADVYRSASIIWVWISTGSASKPGFAASSKVARALTATGPIRGK